MKFRHKPVVIDAVKASDLLDAAISNWKALPVWIASAYEDGEIIFLCDGVSIKTLEGNMLARPDDWVIRGVKGEIHPCKSDIFEATYETA